MNAALAFETERSQRMDFPIPQRRVTLSFRVAESRKKHTLAILRMWQLMAKASGEPQETIDQIDLSYVSEQLLDEGLKVAWAKLGTMANIPLDDAAETGRPYPGMPMSDEEWGQMEKALLRGARAAKDAKEKDEHKPKR